MRQHEKIRVKITTDGKETYATVSEHGLNNLIELTSDDAIEILAVNDVEMETIEA